MTTLGTESSKPARPMPAADVAGSVTPAGYWPRAMRFPLVSVR